MPRETEHPCTCGPDFEFTSEELEEIKEFEFQCKYINECNIYHCRKARDQCTIPVRSSKLRNPSYKRTKCKKPEYIRDHHAAWISAGGQFPYEGELCHQCGSQRNHKDRQKKCLEAHHMNLKNKQWNSDNRTCIQKLRHFVSRFKDKKFAMKGKWTLFRMNERIRALSLDHDEHHCLHGGAEHDLPCFIIIENKRSNLK